MSLLALANLCAALEPLSDKGFDQLLEEIHFLNWRNPEQAAGIAGPAEDHLRFDNELSDRIRLAVALAPAKSLRSGYRPAREELVKLLGEAQDSPFPEILVPELRFGLSDLALRNGEIRVSLRQLVFGFIWLREATPEAIKWRMFEQVARTNLAAGYPFDALFILDQLEDSGAFHDPDRLFGLELLRAEALGDAREFKEMGQLLDELSGVFRQHPDSTLISTYWVLKAWLAIYESTPLQGIKYLQVARQNLSSDEVPYIEGEILVLEALYALHQEADEKPALDRLQEASDAFAKAGQPGRYVSLLIKATQLPQESSFLKSSLPLLKEQAEYAHQDDSLLAKAYGLAAWVEVMRQSGEIDSGLFAETSRKSLFYQDHFVRMFGQLQVEWLAASRSRPVATPTPPAISKTYYLVILLLLLMVLTLVLALRVHTQQHLNRQLAEAVQQSKLAEQAAAESNRLKSQFLANVSHEIKTPMSGLVGMASLLDELIEEPRQRKYLETIRTCSENLLVIMNDLLDLGRMESGRFEIEHRIMDPVKVVNYSHEMVRDAARKKDLEIIQRIEPDVPSRIVGDETRIGQILTNLLNNAIKFTDRGLITLSVGFEQTGERSGNLVLQVRDTGIGIPEEKLPTVFEPFNQGDSLVDRKNIGSGLGLTICKKLVDLMGGSIGVESEPGKGTSFSVRLPVKTEE